LRLGRSCRKGFESYVADEGENAQKESVRYISDNESIYENGVNVTEDTKICDGSEVSPDDNFVIDRSFKQTNEVQKNAHSDLNLQIRELIEKSDGVWKCKVCGNTKSNYSNMRHHAESHIEGMSHACHICNKTFSNRHSLRTHMDKIHSELLSCDLCGKSGMNKSAYFKHKRTQHKTLF